MIDGVARAPDAGSKNPRVILATTGDGQLSVISSLSGVKFKVWVLTGVGQWTLRRTIDVPKQNLPPRWPDTASLSLTAFCPRSGLVACEAVGQGHPQVPEQLVDVETGFTRIIGEMYSCGSLRGFNYACEMDWATYISLMKHF